jgi:hypothetical protein
MLFSSNLTFFLLPTFHESTLAMQINSDGKWVNRRHSAAIFKYKFVHMADIHIFCGVIGAIATITANFRSRRPLDDEMLVAITSLNGQPPEMTLMPSIGEHRACIRAIIWLQPFF